MKFNTLVVYLLIAIALALAPTANFADDSADLKPFAEAHVVLQLSDQEREAVVLDVANNLIKHYGGPDLVDIEIITFGPGVRLLFAGNDSEQRIASLVENGVRFYVCKNTLTSMEEKNGMPIKLNPHAIPVQTGVARIVDKVVEGYTLVRP